MMDHLKQYIIHSTSFSNNKPLHFLDVPLSEQLNIAALIKNNQGVLLTEWVAPNQTTKSTHWFTLYLLSDASIYCVQSPLKQTRPTILDLSSQFPVCNRLQRAIYELTRIPTRHFKDKRYWLNHGYFPLGILRDNGSTKPARTLHYAFKKVTGDGAHEIPVGPVHAGIIEPGHFRFSVVGERILKLEERFGYTHKGIHQLLKNKYIEDASTLIGRVSGDSTVAYALAFAQACEQCRGYITNSNVILERNIFLERERLMNHIGDIGAIINDAGLPALQSSFSCLKERLLRYNAHYMKHRYMMDCITPFSQNMRLSHTPLKSMITELIEIEKELRSLHKIVETHGGLQDRLQTTGIISTEQAHQLGLLGLTAKASGIDLDIRCLPPMDGITPNFISARTTITGDVAARVEMRFKESFDSINLIRKFIKQLEANTSLTHDHEHTLPTKIGIGIVEGFRGPVTVIVSLDNNRVEWCHFHDPSWQNWLAVEYAIFNNIVADFPLINKSFNLSYSGQDS